jgi:hypothetical protein
MSSESQIPAHWQCCFCGEQVAFDDCLQLEIRASFSVEESQQLRAHSRCLARVVHPSVPLLWE